MIGGIGSIPGAMAGGLLLGMAESYTQGYITTRWSDLVVFVDPDRRSCSSGRRVSSARPTSGRCEMGDRLRRRDLTPSTPSGAGDGAEAARGRGPVGPGGRARRVGGAARRAPPSRAGRLGVLERGSRDVSVVGLADALRRRRRAPARRRRAAATRAASPSTSSLYMLLALGLNVVVGWGGLLDLGYIAFYGVGAYTLRAAQLRPVRPSPADGR